VPVGHSLQSDSPEIEKYPEGQGDGEEDWTEQF